MQKLAKKTPCAAETSPEGGFHGFSSYTLLVILLTHTLAIGGAFGVLLWYCCTDINPWPVDVLIPPSWLPLELICWLCSNVPYLCFLLFVFPPSSLIQPNSLSFPCCSGPNPPVSSISPSPLAFSRKVIHGIALPQASSSAKIPREHGGMAGLAG